MLMYFEFVLYVLFATDLNKLYLNLVNNLRVSVDHMTKGEIREFSEFPFSLQLMFDQTFSNSINYMQKLHK